MLHQMLKIMEWELNSLSDNIMKLNEVFTTTYPYGWVNNRTAVFVSKPAGMRYRVTFEAFEGFDLPSLVRSEVDGEVIAILFRARPISQDDQDQEQDTLDPQDRVDVTGTGDEFAIFSTIKSIIETYIHRHKPPAFIVEAKEESRARLYKRLVQKFKQHGYDMTVTGYDHGHQFWLLQLPAHTTEAVDFTKGQKKHQPIKLRNLLSKENFGKKVKPKAVDVVVKDSKTGKVYGRRTIVQK